MQPTIPIQFPEYYVQFRLSCKEDLLDQEDLVFHWDLLDLEFPVYLVDLLDLALPFPWTLCSCFIISISVDYLSIIKFNMFTEFY